MRVKTDDPHSSRKVHELSTLLTPSAPYPWDTGYSDDGERALALANVTAERFGRLAEMLVEKGVLTLDEAADVAGYSYTLKPA